MKWQIRSARQPDLVDLTEIYNHYVVNTAITFDTEPFSQDERVSWFRQFNKIPEHLLLVATLENKVVGYACSTRIRPKAAYDRSVETTIYLNPDIGGQGYGKKLYAALLLELKKTKIHRCYGIITLPNEASVALHTSLGFKQVSFLSEVGYKFNTYWDTVWLEKKL